MSDERGLPRGGSVEPSQAIRSRSLPVEWTLARRYLTSARRESHSRLLSFLATTGIGLGVGALILSLAALAGFQSRLKEEVLDRTPKLEISPGAGGSLEAIERVVEGWPRVAGVQRQLQGNGWLRVGSGVRPVRLIGFERGVPSRFPGIEGATPGLYVGSRVALHWNLSELETIEVVSSRPTLSPLGPQPRVRRLPLAGVFESGVVEEVDFVALPLAEAERLLGTSSRSLSVEVADLSTALQVGAELRKELGATAEVRTWRELNEGLFFALQLERALTFIAVLLVVLVGALALVTSLSFVVSSKRAEIGMLATLGMTPARIRRVFVLLGALLAARSAAVGATVGAGLAWLLNRYQLLPIPGNAFFVEFVPFQLRWQDLATVLVATAVLALACTLQAANRAAAVDPVEALRR